MPYTVGNPPEAIKSLPKHGQEIWIAAFNSAIVQYDGDEAKANAVAWSAIEKAGFFKDKQGNWHWPRGEMVFSIESAQLSSEQIDFHPAIDIAKLTEGDPAPYFVTVRAMKSGISENDFNYSSEIVKKIQSQLPTYGHLGHLKDFQDLSYRFRDPVTIWLAGEIKGDWLYVKGYVPPEQDKLRKQIKLSLKANKPMAVSIHGLMKSLPAKGGKYRDVIDYRLLSIDWANPGTEGITGAGVVQISKEQKNQQKEDSMERAELIASLGMDDLKKERPDLVTAIQGEMANTEQAKQKQKEIDDKIKSLEAENLNLKKQTLESHRTKLLSEYKDKKLRTLAGELLKGETIADLDTSFTTVKTRVAELTQGMPIITGAGNTKPGSDFINKDLL